MPCSQHVLTQLTAEPHAIYTEPPAGIVMSQQDTVLSVEL